MSRLSESHHLSREDPQFSCNIASRPSRVAESKSEHTASIHSRRLSSSLEQLVINPADESPKIVKVDTGCRPKSGSRRTNASVSDFGDDPYYKTISSPFPARYPPRLSIPNTRSLQDSEWGLTGDECRFSTAQSTPRFANSEGCNASIMPASSMSADKFFRRYGNFPNYMANTQSFRAKLRSYSAPKQRPETGPKKRLSLNELMESRNSLSGVRMQRSCSQVQEVISFKNAVIGKLDRSTDFGRELERSHLHRGERMLPQILLLLATSIRDISCRDGEVANILLLPRDCVSRL